MSGQPGRLGRGDRDRRVPGGRPRLQHVRPGAKRFVAGQGRPAQELMQGPEGKPKLRVSIGAPVVVRSGGSHTTEHPPAMPQTNSDPVSYRSSPGIRSHRSATPAARSSSSGQWIARQARVTAGSGPGYRRTP